MKDKKIVICPNCQKLVEAKEYFSSEGPSDWRVESIGVSIVCSKCDYSGLPLQLDEKNYEKMLKINKRKKK